MTDPVGLLFTPASVDAVVDVVRAPTRNPEEGLALLAAAQITLYQRYRWEDYSLSELADDVRRMISSHKEPPSRVQ